LHLASPRKAAEYVLRRVKARLLPRPTFICMVRSTRLISEEESGWLRATSWLAGFTSK
jgi:hypothetical protein